MHEMLHIQAIKIYISILRPVAETTNSVMHSKYKLMA